jgi:hypothetical protein
MDTITERNSKEDVITASLEIIDSQQLQLNTLKQQQSILFVIVSVLVIGIMM